MPIKAETKFAGRQLQRLSKGIAWKCIRLQARRSSRLVFGCGDRSRWDRQSSTERIDLVFLLNKCARELFPSQIATAWGASHQMSFLAVAVRGAMGHRSLEREIPVPQVARDDGDQNPDHVRRGLDMPVHIE